MTTGYPTAGPVGTHGPALGSVPFLARRPQGAAGPAALPTMAPAEPAPTMVRADLDPTVRAVRAEVATRMQSDRTGQGLDEPSRQEAGRALIEAVVRDHNDGLRAKGSQPLTATAEAYVRQAVFDAIFRLGPFQSLVDMVLQRPSGERVGVTDIEIYGHNLVLMIFADGTKRWFSDLFASDEEMVEFLQLLGSRDPNREQAFTPARPFLEMTLPGRLRLAAVGFAPTAVPRVTIRLQHLKHVDLAMLRAQDEIDTVIESFLTAAVRARKSIIVSGQGQGSGKTTFLRGLASAIPATESVCTVEDVYELYLHEDRARHHRVTALQAFAGAGETDAAGRTTGQILTPELLRRALRHNIGRIIVGEVRDPHELLAMFESMQMGNGSMSTVHADRARDVVERLVGLAVRDASVGENYAYRQIASTVDLIVYLGMEEGPDGSRTRYVREIIEPTRGEGGQPVAITDVFIPGHNGRAIPHVAPSFLPDLVGFDPHLMSGTGTWRAR